MTGIPEKKHSDILVCLIFVKMNHYFSAELIMRFFSSVAFLLLECGTHRSALRKPKEKVINFLP